ncbi:MAG: methyltransferase [Hyphomicrobiales bacterium]|nr:MAG: methyltransferase [Hyphomicrobiales bacterium]
MEPTVEDEGPLLPSRGDRYRPLAEGDMGRIHDAALAVLERIGLANAPPSCVEALTRAGAIPGADGRIRFPRGLVLDTIARAGRRFTLHGQKPRHDMAVQGPRIHFGTAGAAVHLVDIEARDYRESRLADIYDAARIVDVMDNIHFFQRPMVARDMVDPADLDLNTLYACVAGTTKHVGTSFSVRENVAPALDLLHTVAGGEEKFRARPFVSNSNPFVASPLKFAANACGVLEACVEGGLPILLLSTAQAGATAPPTLAGAVAQALAEVLAGLVYVNALKPGHPCILGTFPFACDPRTGAMAGGSAEQGLMTAACAQMARFYDLPGGSAAGMADSKLPDVQSGYEKGITETMAALSGLSLVYEAAGMHASLGGFCLESLIVDNDMIGECLACARGIEVSHDTLSVDAIARACLDGPGHYLGHERPAAAARERRHPAFADRLGVKEWLEEGCPDMLRRAAAEKRRILDGHFPRHVRREIDEALRARHPNIHLPRSAMGWQG